jgi:hypothetical protein
MGAYLEVWTSAGRELVALEADRLTGGADAANDLVLAAGPDPVAAARRPGARRGGLVRARPGLAQRHLRQRPAHLARTPLHPGDELRVGATWLDDRGDQAGGGQGTQASEPAPELPAASVRS